MKNDPINPNHYKTDSGLETIQVIDSFFKNHSYGLYLSHVFKYISRAGKKGTLLEDLKKAQWWLTHVIEIVEEDCKNTENTPGKLSGDSAGEKSSVNEHLTIWKPLGYVSMGDLRQQAGKLWNTSISNKKELASD